MITLIEILIIIVALVFVGLLFYDFYETGKLQKAKEEEDRKKREEEKLAKQREQEELQKLFNKTNSNNVDIEILNFNRIDVKTKQNSDISMFLED